LQRCNGLETGKFGMVRRSASLLVVALWAAWSAAETVTWQHGYGFLKPLALPADFPHFSYVNPHAPKGGEIRLAELGTWDNFNFASAKGRDAQGLNMWTTQNLVYDQLLEQAADEPTARYGRLAESVAIAEDGSWIAFRLRHEARWHDGEPITARDLEFTFDVYRNRAAPTIRAPLSAFDRVEVVNDHEVRYWVREGMRGDPVLPTRLGNLPVLPEHYWRDRDVTATTVEPPLGSGPYRIADFAIGRYVRYQRVPDYWGRDLPVNRGRYNFDYVRYDYFRDEYVQYEGIKGGLVDLREENNPRRWALEYDFPAARRGLLRQELLDLDAPAGLWWPIFWNLRRERFQDPRVREALWLLYDFEWTNDKLNHGFWDQGLSFFHNSEMAHRGLPSQRELALLEPLRDRVPPRVFEAPFAPPPNQGNGWNREHVRRALELFEEAGWVVRDRRLVHHDTGEPFRIDFVLVSTGLLRAVVPYIQVLRQVGIQATGSAPELSNWLYRMRAGDFDAGAIAFQPDVTPTLILSNSFSSTAAEQAFSFNWAHVRDPAVDALIGAVYAARTYEDLIAATRAIDRVLLWNFYYVPGMSRTRVGLTWWDKFGKPDHPPLARQVHYDVWWWDAARAARVAARAEDL
jgi:microcin C transport system substrate-binding protein